MSPTLCHVGLWKRVENAPFPHQMDECPESGRAVRDAIHASLVAPLCCSLVLSSEPALPFGIRHNALATIKG